MLMARSSRRFSFSTNSSKAAWGRQMAEMPLFKSTGVGEKAEFVVGMVRAALAIGRLGGFGNFDDSAYSVAGAASATTCSVGDGSLHGGFRSRGSDVLGLGFGNFEWLASFNQGKTPRLDVGLRRHKITWLPRRINGSRIGGRSTPLAAQIPERIEREQHAKKILFPCLFVFQYGTAQ